MILTDNLQESKMSYLKNAINHILTHCGGLADGESLAILCDKTTEDLGQAFKSEALNITKNVVLTKIPLAKKHGEEPSQGVKEIMVKSDLIISLCRYSLAHSKARIDAASHGARFLSLPFYNWDLLNNPAVVIDYKSQATVVRKIADLFSEGFFVYVTTQAGTNMKLDIQGRKGNYCPGFVVHAGDLGSPPDIEANVPPLENRSEGTIVVDGSITCSQIGLLEKPLVLTVRDGKVEAFEGEKSDQIDLLNEIFGGLSSKRRVLAECGVGLNPLAKLSGSMLIDEGALGTVHFGLGSNYTIGGENEIDFHLDFVIRKATLKIDGKMILRDGELVL